MIDRDWPPQPYLPPKPKRRVDVHNVSAAAAVTGMAIAALAVPTAALVEAVTGRGVPLLIGSWAVAWVLVIGSVAIVTRGQGGDDRG